MAKNDVIKWWSGGLCIMRPVTKRAIDWCNEHLPDDAPRWAGGSYVVEHRFVDDITSGMEMAGLKVV